VQEAGAGWQSAGKRQTYDLLLPPACHHGAGEGWAIGTSSRIEWPFLTTQT